MTVKSTPYRFVLAAALVMLLGCQSHTETELSVKSIPADAPRLEGAASDTKLQTVLQNAAALTDQAVTVRGTLIDIVPVPFSSLVIGRLAEGNDTIAFVAPLEAVMPPGRRVRLKGRVLRQGLPGIVSITVGPVLVVGDSSTGGAR